ncbi:MAG: hypothetical protein QXE05_09005 [Nitrososphaeria archaeon]
MPTTNVNIKLIVLGYEFLHFLLLVVFVIEGVSLIERYHNSSTSATLIILLITWPPISALFSILGHKIIHVSVTRILHLRTKITFFHKRGSTLILILKQLNISAVEHIALTLSKVFFNILLFIVVLCIFYVSLFQGLILELVVMPLYVALVNFIIIIDSLNIVAAGNDLYILLCRFGYPVNKFYGQGTLHLKILRLLSYVKYGIGRLFSC